ncbi:MAG: CoA-transferase subunit beta [Elusimicrobia bacterium]|nr:CoA-transferase subunit beta [Elusimicrobiota bacterium]MDE2425020.1 CoA-transferase subunit beta [Elusimicrobiota bacterium]
MCALAAREIKDEDVVFVGIGLPNLACNLARATHAPNLTLIYESGAVGARPERVPPSIGDPALVTGSLMVCSMADVFQSFLQNGKIQVGFLGGAQIDMRGNINTTVVGPYAAPKVRLPGSGGACEIALHARRLLVIAKLDRRAFPQKVDFVTSPGKRVGKVITNMCVLEPDPASGELCLSRLYPGVTPAQVQANVGWPLRRLEPLGSVKPPTPTELSLLRDCLDPERRYIK